MLEIDNLEVRFSGLAEPALAIPRLSLAPGARLAVGGASGSGKSTFVNVVTGLARPSAGRVAWNDREISGLGEGARDRWRGASVGLVMQDFHLFPGLSAFDNVMLPARLARAADARLADRARDLLRTVGLARPEQRVETLSRGEMQRVAVARALLRTPALLVADEPTASLDAAAGAEVADLLFDLAEAATLIVVSHDPRLLDRAGRRIVLERGRIVSDEGGER